MECHFSVDAELSGAIPTIGRNLLGESQCNRLMQEIQPRDQVIAVMGEGRYSFTGNGCVGGGIFDRLQLQQGGKVISFHDIDYYRLDDVYIDGFLGFNEITLFIVRTKYEFDLGQPWQVGALDSMFTSFFGNYVTSDAYIDRPAPVVLEAFEVSEPLWMSVWRDRAFQIAVLSICLLLLTIIIFLQGWLVRYPRLLRNLRPLFLLYTVLFIG